MTEKKYPCEVKGKIYDREWLEQVILTRSEFMRQHHVPVMLGEYGWFYTNSAATQYCFDLMTDLIDLIERHGHHWTIWTYKDIGKLGLVYVNPESAWMIRTRTVRDLKTILRCDFWVERHDSEIGRYLDQMIAYIHEVVADQTGDWSILADNVYGAVCEYTLSQMLIPAYAEQFHGINEEEIDGIMQSFAFKNCLVHTELAEHIAKRFLGTTDKHR